MIPAENRQPMQAAEGRECGSCYACCVWLGIDELKKYAGQSCKKLTGANGPNRRCGIYNRRPSACSHFQCSWKQGMFGDDDRPDNSGFLCTFYKLDTGVLAATITITDAEKAGTFESGGMAEAIKYIMLSGADEIRIVNYLTKSLVYFYQGNIYEGRLHKPNGFEELKFEAWHPAVGQYMVADSPEEAEKIAVPKGKVRTIL